MIAAEWRPELIIFDCDGVLIDSEVISATVLLGLLEVQGLSIDVGYVQKHFLGRSFPTVAEAIRQQFDLDLPVDFEAEYRRRLLCAFEDTLKATDGLVDTLEKLDGPYCVATSSSPERANRSLTVAGLHSYFNEHIYTASEVARGKPAPDLFLHVALREGTRPENCLVIEDSAPGIQAALAAGMKVLHYVGGSHFADVASRADQQSRSVAVFDSWRDFFDMVPSLRVEAR